MKYVVAVSGGVDSMVLLDMLVRSGDHELVVAHFDHGIRPDSGDDALFVKKAAYTYDLPFELQREELGATASEAYARERRYAFLRTAAEKHRAVIATAHHLDDVVETIAINLVRGTGWRGLAVLDSEGIHRPLIDMEKAEILAYAKQHAIAWREDSTNATDAYLRNRLRTKTSGVSSDTKRELRALHAVQCVVKQDIKKELQKLIGEGPVYNRHFFTQVPAHVGIECLREITEGRLTRPQLHRALHAIKVARPRATYQAGEGIELHFTTRQFSL